MFLHQSAYLDNNVYRAGYPGHMNQLGTIPHREVMNMNTHIRLAQGSFGDYQVRHCYWVVQMAFWAGVVLLVEVASALVLPVWVGWVEVHLFLFVSTMAADSLGCHFAKEGIYPFGFDEALPGVVQLQPSAFHVPETERLGCSLLGLQRKVC
jgi:hypothetical protein